VRQHGACATACTAQPATPPPPGTFRIEPSDPGDFYEEVDSTAGGGSGNAPPTTFSSCEACLVAAGQPNSNMTTPKAGEEMRWQLPAAAQGSGGTLQDVAHMVNDVRHMHSTFVSGAG
jgi:hypothetical protein